MFQFLKIKRRSNSNTFCRFDANEPGFFTPGVRARIIDFIIRRKRFSDDPSDDFAFGIDRLLRDKVYTGAYPLHDVRNRYFNKRFLKPLKTVFENSFDFMLRIVGGSEETREHTLPFIHGMGLPVEMPQVPTLGFHQGVLWGKHWAIFRMARLLYEDADPGLPFGIPLFRLRACNPEKRYI